MENILHLFFLMKKRSKRFTASKNLFCILVMWYFLFGIEFTNNVGFPLCSQFVFDHISTHLLYKGIFLSIFLSCSSHKLIEECSLTYSFKKNSFIMFEFVGTFCFALSPCFLSGISFSSIFLGSSCNYSSGSPTMFNSLNSNRVSKLCWSLVHQVDLEGLMRYCLRLTASQWMELCIFL